LKLLEGKVAFITGSTRGIGWTTAELFAAHGATVVLNGHSSAERLEARVTDLKDRFAVQASGILSDISNPEEVRGVYQQLFKQYKRLDVLVNNAGILEDALLGMISDDVVARSFAVNAIGVVHNVQGAARLMSRASSGSIINLTSIIGTNGNRGQVVYGATKAAVIGLTKSAAKELAVKNIRVNAIAPGFIDTDMTRALPDEKFAERVSSIKMQRVGSTTDIANAALFFASDLSTYVTGQVLGVDGGMLI
jgi:3-oxoacyl-[acyl-carrier protein] reductase